MEGRTPSRMIGSAPSRRLLTCASSLSTTSFRSRGNLAWVVAGSARCIGFTFTMAWMVSSCNSGRRAASVRSRRRSMPPGFLPSQSIWIVRERSKGAPPVRAMSRPLSINAQLMLLCTVRSTSEGQALRMELQSAIPTIPLPSRTPVRLRRFRWAPQCLTTAPIASCEVCVPVTSNVVRHALAFLRMLAIRFSSALIFILDSPNSPGSVVYCRC